MRFHTRALVLVPLFLLGAVSFVFAQSPTFPPTQPPAQQPAQPAQAQVAGTTVSKTDGRYLSFDVGMVGGINIGANAARVGRTVGMDVTVSDSMSLGFMSTTSGATAYSLMKVSYFLTPALGLSIYLGSDGNTAAGAGVFYNVLRSRPDDGLSTSLKLRLEYLFDSGAGLTNGDLVLSVGTSVGL